MTKKITQSTLPITEFRKAFGDRLILSGDTGYDKARMGFYGGVDRHPVAIFRVVNAQEVSQVILWAHEYGFELAIRSGGHSVAGHSTTEGGVLLDLSLMKGLQIDAKECTAWAETGLTAGEYTVATAKHGLATGFGDTGSVGIGGITLGGGIGYLVRKHGLTIDSLLAAEVVTADGQILQVDENNHPDLFWAIRGGGGNFGVVTRFQFKLHDVNQVMGGVLFLPATANVIASFIGEAESASEELSTIVNVMPAPPMPFLAPEHHGKLVIMALMMYSGDLAQGEKVFTPFRKLASPLADMIRPMSYPEMYPPEQGDYHPVAASRTMFMDHVDVSVAETILENLKASSAAMSVTQLRVLGGAMARVPVDATAFAHRQSRIMTNLAGVCRSVDEKDVHEAWVSNFEKVLRQDDQGSYVNFLGVADEAQVHAAYPGETWKRLRQVKAKYDPTNLFRLNQNVPPL